MAELLSLEISIKIRSMDIEWFESMNGGVAAREMYLLDWMLKVDED